MTVKATTGTFARTVWRTDGEKAAESLGFGELFERSENVITDMIAESEGGSSQTAWKK